jgi:hypothetical protein
LGRFDPLSPSRRHRVKERDAPPQALTARFQ